MGLCGSVVVGCLFGFTLEEGFGRGFENWMRMVACGFDSYVVVLKKSHDYPPDLDHPEDCQRWLLPSLIESQAVLCSQMLLCVDQVRSLSHKAREATFVWQQATFDPELLLTLPRASC